MFRLMKITVEDLRALKNEVVNHDEVVHQRKMDLCMKFSQTVMDMPDHYVMEKGDKVITLLFNVK